MFSGANGTFIPSSIPMLSGALSSAAPAEVDMMQGGLQAGILNSAPTTGTATPNDSGDALQFDAGDRTDWPGLNGQDFANDPYFSSSSWNNTCGEGSNGNNGATSTNGSAPDSQACRSCLDASGLNQSWHGLVVLPSTGFDSIRRVDMI